MGKINLKVRLKNKKFIVSLVSFILLNIQVIAKSLGYEFGLEVVSDTAMAFINIIFAVFAFLGLVQDPTTQGYSDSENALTYTEPK